MSDTNLEETTVQKILRERAEKQAGNDAATSKGEESKVPAPAIQVTEEKSYHVFYNSISSCKMLTETGRVISFVSGKYITQSQEEIDYLNKEMAHPDNIYISVVKGQEVMTATELDPMAVLRKKHFEELAAIQAEVARKIAAGEPLSQSESEAQALTPGSTSDIASLAAE